jgi:hypothetical protein
MTHERITSLSFDWISLFFSWMYESTFSMKVHVFTQSVVASCVLMRMVVFEVVMVVINSSRRKVNYMLLSCLQSSKWLWDGLGTLFFYTRISSSGGCKIYIYIYIYNTLMCLLFCLYACIHQKKDDAIICNRSSLSPLSLSYS